MATRTDVFSKLVRDFARPDPLVVQSTTPLAKTVGQMATEKRSAAVVADADGGVAGLVTEQDIVRRVALRADGGQPTADVMSAPVATIGADEYLYYAVARMRRLGYRHMPVVGGDGRLLDEGLPALEIQALLTHVNNDIYRRIVARSAAEMEAEGLGAAPVDFAVIVMGSGGRGENYVHPDQDNGFIIDDYPDDAHTAIDGWFIELATRMTRRLDHAGLPLCEGFVMATNPLWRKRRAEWAMQTTLWSQRRKAATLRHCDIFFDFRCAYGRADFADELRAHITRLAKGNEPLLRAMCDSGAGPGPGLGWFGRFRTVSEPEEYRGHLNLKHGGSLPLVTGMRLLALREGIPAASTLARMAALAAAGLLTRDDHDELASAYRFMSRLLLKQQLADFDAGRKVTNFVHPGTLTRHETQELEQAFRAVTKFSERVRFEFMGEVY
ncbi:MAG: putative nucleotidyltransferase substrate binding domain-containing protein [Rhodospirillaceae bacterium]